ncbi:MAG: argininosuccinate lyase [Rhodospirillales bacterium]|nr:argininosuccinate lyase [Rhodospirillales bacterium]
MTNQAPSSPGTMWGGRFDSGPVELMRRINASHPFDRKLWQQDIRQSRAHAEMLKDRGLISASDHQAILDGLAQVETEIASGAFSWSDELEDIHMHVEHRLTEISGPAGKRLHTARSRNDQVATSMRLWVRDTLDQLDAGLRALQSALLDHADRHAGSVMPGFTHLQPAQPVTLGHHLLAYVEMLDRDRGRIRDARDRLNECPLGSAALAGTPFPIDREETAQALGFRQPMRNSIDAVSDRDFVLEVLSAAVIAAVHLSRLAEELVLWSTPAFGFVSLPDAFSTGSSIMPQKRNPDAAELVRGKTGRILGAFVAIATVLKALPLAYAKDLQEDKEPLFDAADALAVSVAALTGMIEALSFNTTAMRAMAEVGHPTATDLADWLVGQAEMPFRDAHAAAGRAVRLAEERSCRLDELSLADLQSVVPEANADVFNVLGIEASLGRRTSAGGAAPDLVRSAVAAARTRLQ